MVPWKNAAHMRIIRGIPFITTDTCGANVISCDASHLQSDSEAKDGLDLWNKFMCQTRQRPSGYYQKKSVEAQHEA
jgi:hypothetical protein